MSSRWTSNGRLLTKAVNGGTVGTDISSKAAFNTDFGAVGKASLLIL